MSSTDNPDSAPAAFTRPGFITFLGLASGAVLAEAADFRQPFVALSLAVAVLVLGVALLSRRPGWLIGVVYAVFAALGLAGHAGLLQREADSFARLEALADGGSPLAIVEGRLSAMPRPWGGEGWQVTLLPGAQVETRGETTRIASPVAVVCSKDLFTGLVAGDTVRAVGTLEELPRPRLGAEPRHGFRTQGCVALFRAVRADLSLEAPRLYRPLLVSAQSAAARISSNITGRMDPREGALMLAMMTGRTNQLHPDDTEAFRRTGLMHVFAVSGMHTMLIGGTLIWLLQLLGFRATIRLALLILALAFFVGLVGFRTSVLRAAILLVIYDARNVMQRPVEPLAALGTVASLMMLLWPGILWQADFQLTFLCVLALMVLSPWLMEVRMLVGRVFRWRIAGFFALHFLMVLLGSFAIQLMLTPIMLAWWGEVSIVSPIANMALLSLTSIAVLVGFASEVLRIVSPAAADVVLVCMNFVLWFIRSCASEFSSIPGAVLRGDAMEPWQAGVWFVVLLAGPWAQARRVTQPRRGAWPFIAAAAVLPILLLTTGLTLPSRAVQIQFIDVGQGDATLIRVSGRSWLVDAGPPGAGSELVRRLQADKIHRLEGLFATHADADHIGGMPALLAEIDVARLYVNGGTGGSVAWTELADTVQRRWRPIQSLRRGAIVPLSSDGRVLLRVLHPDGEFLATESDRNETSLVMMLEAHGRRVLLTGDAEARAEEALLAHGGDLTCDVLKCGHHGAAESTGAALLAATRPAVAVASCGRDNNYGHPSRELLDRLDGAGVSLYRTDRDGTVTLTIRPDGSMTWRAGRAVEVTAPSE